MYNPKYWRSRHIFYDETISTLILRSRTDKYDDRPKIFARNNPWRKRTECRKPATNLYRRDEHESRPTDMCLDQRLHARWHRSHFLRQDTSHSAWWSAGRRLRYVTSLITTRRRKHANCICDQWDEGLERTVSSN